MLITYSAQAEPTVSSFQNRSNASLATLAIYKTKPKTELFALGSFMFISLRCKALTMIWYNSTYPHLLIGATNLFAEREFLILHHVDHPPPFRRGKEDRRSGI
jgi:hypothetical protein